MVGDLKAELLLVVNKIKIALYEKTFVNRNEIRKKLLFGSVQYTYIQMLKYQKQVIFTIRRRQKNGNLIRRNLLASEVSKVQSSLRLTS